MLNFEKDATTNSLKYTGLSAGRFHVVATFNFYSAANKTCGFYIGKNTNPSSPLDPNGDRISESEIYADAISQTKPSAAAIQTIVDLNPNDRVFFIVQNKESNADITVEFLKFIATSLTAEKGDAGPNSVTNITTSNGTASLSVSSLSASGDITANNMILSGNQVATVVDPVRTTLTGNGVLSAFAISGAGSLSNPSALIVAIDGALQEPTVDYGVSGGVITFTSPLANGAKAVVISPTNTLQVTQMIPADGSVTSAKLANDLEISGIVGFNSTTRPTSDGTGTPAATSLITLADADARFIKNLPAVYEWTKTVGDYTSTVVSTGTTSTATNVLQMASGATAGGSALLRSDANSFRAWHRSATGRQAPDWAKQTAHYVRISSDAFSGADTVFRIHLGLPFSLTTLQNLQPTNKAIGFNVVAGEIFATVANGSAVTTVSTGVTMVAWKVFDCTITSNGDGTWSATVNDTTVSGTGAPSTLGSPETAALVVSATNGTTAATRRFFINNQKTIQF